MTWSSQFFNGSLCDVRHKAHNGKYDDPSKHTGAGVYTAHNDRIPIDGTTRSTESKVKKIVHKLNIISEKRSFCTSDCMTSTHHMCIMSEHLDREYFLLVDIIVVGVVTSQSNERT